MITPLQVEALLFLVAESKSREGLVPTAKELAVYLHRTTEVGHNEIAAAYGLIARLERSFQCFYRRRGHAHKRFIRPSFVTEPESAKYLMTLYDLCQESANRSTTRAALEEALVNLDASVYHPERLAVMFRRVQQGKYIAKESASTIPGLLRRGQRLNNLVPYLRALVADGGQ